MCAFLQLLTGKGALQQLGFETGLPIQELDGIVLFIIAFNLIAALLPAKVRTPFLSLSSVLLDIDKIATQPRRTLLSATPTCKEHISCHTVCICLVCANTGAQCLQL